MKKSRCVRLPETETKNDNIGNLTTASRSICTSEIATVENRLGFSVVRRQDGFREVSITADIDTNLITTPEALEKVREGGLDKIVQKYDLRYRYDGRDSERAEAFGDMQVGAIMALVCIYIILAWVFSSWLLPFAVMIMIPFALIGAVVGIMLWG